MSKRKIYFKIIDLRAVLSTLIYTFFLLLAASASYTQEQAEKIKIGIPLPLSGGLAASGEDLRDAFIVAKEFLKADQFELLFEDDACDSKKGVTVAHKLLEVDKVDVMSGIYCNHTLLPTAPIYNRKLITVLSTGSTTGDILGIGKRIFRLFPADQFALNPLLELITKKHQRLCMLTALDAYSELMMRTVKKKYAELSSSFELITEDIDPSVNDYRSIITKMLAKGCEGFYLNSPSDEIFITMYKQLKQLNKSAAIYAVYNPGSGTVVAALGKQLNGTIYADLQSRSDLATDLGKEFLALYEKRFGEFRTSQPLGLLAFEALRLITQAYQAKTPLDEFIRNRKISDGAIKEYSFDADGAIEGISFKVLRFHDGASEVVS